MVVRELDVVGVIVDEHHLLRRDARAAPSRLRELDRRRCEMRHLAVAH